MRVRAVSVLLIVLFPLFLRSQAPAAPAKTPKLAVILVVDQMRADYVDRFRSDWTSGLKRIVDRGARFTNAAYPYFLTMTCAGHATISTGTFPRSHGVISNEWWDRDRGKETTCTEDPKANNIGYVNSASGGDSAYRMGVRNLADELRAQKAARVVSISMKDRSAIMLAGHGPGIVTWLNTALDNLVTSSAFTQAAVPDVKEFVRTHALDGDFGKVWDRLLPADRYPEPDDGAGELPPRGWSRTFPHVLSGSGGKPDAVFRAQWDRSPFVDAYLGRLAEWLAASAALGRHEGTDLLAISFSGTDRVGHQFGPNSQEVHDTQLRLDRTIGSLLERLDSLVGPENYVVVLTADHGVTPFSEQLLQSTPQHGQVDLRRLVDDIERKVQSAFGPGRYVEALNGANMNLYFSNGTYDRLADKPALLNDIVSHIQRTPGIRKVMRREEAITGGASSDPLVRSAALSYFPGRTGDLIIAIEPGWTPIAAVSAIHWSGSPSDQRVPLILLGAGIRPGQYDEAVTPADIAPTLAALVGIAMPYVEGRVLTSAIVQGR